MADGCVLTKVYELIDPINHSWDISALRGALKSQNVMEALKAPIGWKDQEDNMGVRSIP